MTLPPDGTQVFPELPASLAAERRGATALLRLSRPDKRNALDDATILGLETFFARLPAAIRAVVLCAEGEHFSAGLDLQALQATDLAAGIAHSRMWHRVFEQIEHGPVPVLAVLHGAVIGGGLELACAAHIRIAERSTFYALPEGERGIFVGGGGAVRLPRLIGAARMIDMMLTGRSYGAEDGQAIGLSQYLVEDGQGLAKALELAARIGANTRLTNFAVIQALPRIAGADPAAGLLCESLMAAIAQNEPEAKQRLDDFLAKRAAKVRHGKEPQ